MPNEHLVEPGTLSQWVPVVRYLEECLLIAKHFTYMPSRVFLCKCVRCCDVGDDGVPMNPGGKEVPIAAKTVHTMQGVNMASSTREASVLHLARQVQHTELPHTTDNQASSEYQLNTSASVDDLAAELFSMMLTDDETDPDRHSKLWISRSEVQQDRGQAHSSLDATVDAGAGLTLDDTQHITRALQVVEMRRQSRAQITLANVESQINRTLARISSARSRDVLRAIRDELSVIATTLRKIKHKVTSIVSHRSRLETSCDGIHRLLDIKEDELSVSSEPFDFDSYHVLRLTCMKHTITIYQSTIVTKLPNCPSF
ncbi:hypothetical protein EDD22DRAFT_854651 [Suillus occidentalis]|nr:hypothetical protein EDD22DRAFT_854651 [Suillus occidentalis]